METEMEALGIRQERGNSAPHALLPWLPWVTKASSRVRQDAFLEEEKCG
jgi:hypothetical protein